MSRLREVLRFHRTATHSLQVSAEGVGLSPTLRYECLLQAPDAGRE